MNLFNTMRVYCCYVDAGYSRDASEVVYPLVDKNAATEAVSMTPLYKTLQSYLASGKLNSKRFALYMCYLLSTVWCDIAVPCHTIRAAVV